MPDITVEEGIISTADNGLNLREADLSRHLLNPKEGEETPPVMELPKVTPEPKQEGEEDGKTDDKNVPMEPGSKSDYQFNQALNLLKGLQILRK